MLCHPRHDASRRPGCITRSALACALAAALVSTLAAGPAGAGTVRYYPAGTTPDARVVADILGGGVARKPARFKLRGVAPLDEPAAQRKVTSASDGGRNVEADPLAHEASLVASAQTAVQTWQSRPGAKPPQEPPTALALPIVFDNDSARLQATSLQSLDAIADGLRLAGPAVSVVIEGHTSASGSWEHNLRLSKARAESVKRYLVQQRGVAAASLRTVGFGPATPLNPKDPNAAENRRVQFRAA